MKLTKKVGVATFIQFGVISLLSIPASLNSIVTTCSADKSDCLSNALTSVILYVLIVGWFGAVAATGYALQEKRKTWIGVVLIFAEFFIGFFAYINARGHTDPLSLVTSIVDIILAVWIAFLAFRVIRKRGGRVVTKHRVRNRPVPKL